MSAHASTTPQPPPPHTHETVVPRTRKKMILVPPMERHPDDLLDAHAVAAMLSVDVSWVKNHCTRVEPLLPYIQLGVGKNAKRRFKREHILKVIEENTRLPRQRA
jgi:hypothetical protein